MTPMQDSYIGNTTASQAVKAGSTPVSCSKKEVTFVYQKLLLFYPSRRLGISSRFSVYIIAVGVYHHRRCILLRLDEIQHCVLMIYNASH